MSFYYGSYFKKQASFVYEKKVLYKAAIINFAFCPSNFKIFLLTSKLTKYSYLKIFTNIQK